MNIDPAAVAYGFVGLAAGVGVNFWKRKGELEERCEFLAEMRGDLLAAFEAAGAVLSDPSTPKPIRSAILFLLAAHTDRSRGKAFARSFMGKVGRREGEQPDGKDPISQSMSILNRQNAPLARQVHHVMASLAFGLVFLNMADDIKVERMKNEAARDPVSLWARIARLFGSNDDHHDHRAGGTLIHA